MTSDATAKQQWSRWGIATMVLVAVANAILFKPFPYHVAGFVVAVLVCLCLGRVVLALIRGRIEETRRRVMAAGLRTWIVSTCALLLVDVMLLAQLHSGTGAMLGM